MDTSLWGVRLRPGQHRFWRTPSVMLRHGYGLVTGYGVSREVTHRDCYPLVHFHDHLNRSQPLLY